jgi:hypothetical protein
MVEKVWQGLYVNTIHRMRVVTLMHIYTSIGCETVLHCSGKAASSE